MKGRQIALGIAVISLGLLVMGTTIAFLGPVVDMAGGDQAAPKGALARGFDVYRSEGCAECHTQQVRPVSNDLGLGKVTDIASLGPLSIPGLVRIGPDLSCFGEAVRKSGYEKGLADYLQDPRSVRPASTMPRYSYLSDTELADLLVYLDALTCEGHA